MPNDYAIGLANALQTSTWQIATASPSGFYYTILKSRPYREPTVLNLLNTVGSVVGRSSCTSTKEECVIGLELENEYKQPVNLPRLRNWTVSSDSSLRHYGFEYVSEPLALSKAMNALSLLTDELNGIPATLTNSIRTSTHVHFDVTRLNFIEVLTFACVYWTLEDFLSDFAGAHRKGNLFCLRLKDAHYTKELITNALKHKDFVNVHLTNNEYRYGGVNFAALKKFGTLEFRMMRGTTDYDTLECWILALEAIRKFSLRFKNPTEYQQYFLNGTTARSFPEEVLGTNLFDKIAAFHNGDVEKTIRNSFDLLDDILATTSFDFTEELQRAQQEEEARKEQEKRKQEALMLYNSNVIPDSGLLEDNVLDAHPGISGYTIDTTQIGDC